MDMRGRRRRTARRAKRRRNYAATAMVALSAVILTAGIVSRLTGSTEVAAQVVTVPTPTPVTAAFDETVETRELVCPADVWYCIQSGIFSTQEAAAEKSSAYADRGAPGMVTRDGDKYRVLLASFGDKSDALAVRDRLAESQKVETYVHEMVCAELPLRVTGMAGQLDVLEAGLLLIPSTARQMRTLAFELDGKQKSMTDAAGEVRDWTEQLNVWTELLNQRFIAPDAPLVAALRGLAAEAQALAATQEQAISEGQTKLSSTLKLSALQLYDSIRAAWNALLASA